MAAVIFYMHLNFDTDAFLGMFWQKKPKLIRKAISNFEDPIEADELAGLAMEDEVASRIIETLSDGWKAHSGPFNDYHKFGSDNWQLLVQAVNHWYPPTLPLVEAFRFIPEWRFDDLMVSFSTPGGGVGPHIDQYDVFIIQGSGKRRWQVGPNTHTTCRNDNTMSLVTDFEAIIDAELNPGDILYIPAGYPHQGQTIEPSMSYSMGFRAPSQKEFISNWADVLEDKSLGEKRLITSEETSAAGILASTTMDDIKALIKESLDSDDFNTITGCLLSKNRFELAPYQPDQDLSIEQCLALFAKETLYRLPGVKVLSLEQDKHSRVFVNGEEYRFGDASIEHCYMLANLTAYPPAALEELCESKDILNALVEMVNQGLMVFDDE
ncbi:cupin domain-containing protein [Paraferrimonas sp. SM1919]|uniref:cupin domain-containing protein n=1 Tax=Paraferrimonas sp. SM1919 TaxID=2662263 RepID=UPI0013D7A8EB|nr:cupin domain-containing protein [Paraferrimonas sp. SM1919]